MLYELSSFKLFSCKGRYCLLLRRENPLKSSMVVWSCVVQIYRLIEATWKYMIEGMLLEIIYVSDLVWFFFTCLILFHLLGIKEFLFHLLGIKDFVCSFKTVSYLSCSNICNCFKCTVQGGCNLVIWVVQTSAVVSSALFKVVII